MAKITVVFSARALEPICLQGYHCPYGYRVTQGISDRAVLQESHVDELDRLILVFDDPTKDEDQTLMIMWEMLS